MSILFPPHPTRPHLIIPLQKIPLRISKLRSVYRMWLKYDWNESMTSIYVMTFLFMPTISRYQYTFLLNHEKNDVRTSQCDYLILNCLFVHVCSNRETSSSSSSSSYTHRFSINILFRLKQTEEWVSDDNTFNSRSEITFYYVSHLTFLYFFKNEDEKVINRYFSLKHKKYLGLSHFRGSEQARESTGRLITQDV